MGGRETISHDPFPRSIDQFYSDESINEWFTRSQPRLTCYPNDNGWSWLQHGHHTFEVYHNGEKHCEVSEPVPTVSPYEDITWVVEFVDLFSDGCNSDWEPDMREFNNVDDARRFADELSIDYHAPGPIRVYGRHPNGGTCDPVDDTRPMGCSLYDNSDDPTPCRPSVYDMHDDIEYTCDINPDKLIYEMKRLREISRRMAQRAPDGYVDNVRDPELFDNTWVADDEIVYFQPIPERTGRRRENITNSSMYV
jgi:hypothetical protein